MGRLQPSNASAANYVWECIKELPYLDRYWIYSEVHWKTYIAHPQVCNSSGLFLVPLPHV